MLTEIQCEPQMLATHGILNILVATLKMKIRGEIDFNISFNLFLQNMSISTCNQHKEY